MGFYIEHSPVRWFAMWDSNLSHTFVAKFASQLWFCCLNLFDILLSLSEAVFQDTVKDAHKLSA